MASGGRVTSLSRLHFGRNWAACRNYCRKFCTVRKHDVNSHRPFLCHPNSYCTFRTIKQHILCSQHCGEAWLQPNSRPTSTDQEHKSAVSSPYKLVAEDLSTLCNDIKKELSPSPAELKLLSQYHFDGKGKAFRPMVVMLAAKACNIHYHQHPTNNALLASQRVVAFIAEMIHTASLIHDDVIDLAATRRGRPSVQEAWGQRNAILAGNFIMSAACVALARIRNTEVIKILSQVLEDLVSGEFMQLGSKEDEDERFNHYLQKTYKKTASLLANSCKAVAVLSGCDESSIEQVYQYGRNIGIAFQLVDDLLDFISTEQLMGKPTAADLKLGLATAPVLFAAHQSNGIAHTKFLAEQHSNEAIKQISMLFPSDERNALITLTHNVLHRLK
ncbi:hypothetical protein LSH36_241g02035 [Paralvinella palmiformis]|uniref:Decaprenyl-diphosphate synthase subunit 1 n=1 Tax=Paralvinella palmiformis TaxID=53620 RepID=A0AAD9N556_9ANNE|nr:hypothetical protein LSH36_241g02035 [Paralvinella palmiformis]